VGRWRVGSGKDAMPLPNLRLVPRLDEWARLRPVVETPVGRLAAVVFFTLGLYAHGVERWPSMGITLALTSLFPRHRRALLVVAALAWALLAPLPLRSYVRTVAADGLLLELAEWRLFHPIALALGLGVCVAFHSLARRHSDQSWTRRPVRAWLISVLALLAVALHAPLPGAVRLWLLAVAVITAHYAWFVALSLLDRKSAEPRAVLRHLGCWRPFWMALSDSSTPYGKGSAYLRRIEAKDLAELAVTQLKGIKLLWWAGILEVADQLLGWFASGAPRRVPELLGLERHLDLPRYADVFGAHLAGSPVPPHVAWGALVLTFMTTMLRLSIYGHVIVAICRMAGFRALRNTYRPLESRSIAEFWNRYYYYFKELLVEVFFYPTFLRYWRGHPRTRLFVATLAAAGGGNFLYHFLANMHGIAREGLPTALWSFRVYFVYCALLGAAIGLSQLRAKRLSTRGSERGWIARRVVAPVTVLAFYCVLSVFDGPMLSTSITVHVTFLGNLVGL
jgi:hypothetical protein